MEYCNVKKLYVGCGLTGVSEEFRNSVEDFKQALRADFEVFDFVGLEQGTAADVYNWDIGHCVRTCDAFVGICDYPSFGLGWELAEATRLAKPTLAIAHESLRITRLILGAAAVEPQVEFRTYDGTLRQSIDQHADWYSAIRQQRIH